MLFDNQIDNYLLNLLNPANPTKPVPSRRNMVGSGTALARVKVMLHKASS
jgi:hypothetical protein